MTISLRTRDTITVREEVVTWVGKNSNRTMYLRKEYNWRGACWKSTILTGESLTNYLYRPVESIAQAA